MQRHGSCPFVHLILIGACQIVDAQQMCWLTDWLNEWMSYPFSSISHKCLIAIHIFHLWILLASSNAVYQKPKNKNVLKASNPAWVSCLLYHSYWYMIDRTRNWWINICPYLLSLVIIFPSFLPEWKGRSKIEIEQYTFFPSSLIFKPSFLWSLEDLKGTSSLIMDAVPWSWGVNSLLNDLNLHHWFDFCLVYTLNSPISWVFLFIVWFRLNWREICPLHYSIHYSVFCLL